MPTLSDTLWNSSHDAAVQGAAVQGGMQAVTTREHPTAKKSMLPHRTQKLAHCMLIGPTIYLTDIPLVVELWCAFITHTYS